MKKSFSFILIALLFLFSVSCSKTVTKTNTVTITDTITVTKTDTVTKLDSNVHLTNGLIAYYPFNGNANDVSGNNLNGTINGGVSFGNDVKGNANSAVTFDGSTGYILVSDPSNKFQTNQVSISFLTNVTNASVRNAFVASLNFTNSGGLSYAVQISQAGLNKFQFGVVSNSTACGNAPYDPNNAVNGANNVTENIWHSVVAIFADSLQSIYIDGILNTAMTRSFGTLNQCSSNQDFVIGGWWSGDLISLAGSMDEVRVYNRVLNQNEIAELASPVQ